MAKMFSVRLEDLEKEMKELKDLNIEELKSDYVALRSKTETKIIDLETKFNKLIDEITTILNSHAQAIKELKQINSK